MTRFGQFLAAGVTTMGVLSVLAAAQVQEEKLGQGVTLTEATSIKALYEAPESFVGKTVRVDGVVTAVCDAMGCWMALAQAADSTEVVRFKVEHEAGIVFPIKAKGRPASAEGVFEKIAAGDKEGQSAAAEQAAATGRTSDFGTTYQIKATGAVIR